jgi:DNA-binding transcriptional ArsR family regulator
MRILREAGLVEDVRQGRWMVYRIPARSREFINGLVEGLGRAGLGRPARRPGDARKLADCVRQDIRARDGRGPRAAAGRRRSVREECRG